MLQQSGNYAVMVDYRLAPASAGLTICSSSDQLTPLLGIVGTIDSYKYIYICIYIYMHIHIYVEVYVGTYAGILPLPGSRDICRRILSLLSSRDICPNPGDSWGLFHLAFRARISCGSTPLSK